MKSGTLSSCLGVCVCVCVLKSTLFARFLACPYLWSLECTHVVVGARSIQEGGKGLLTIV